MSAMVTPAPPLACASMALVSPICDHQLAE
jgi:hypothetical protein